MLPNPILQESISPRFLRKAHLCCGVLLLLIALQAQAQVTVTGVVKDDKGNTLVGVNVVVEKTTKGTVTDLNGSYSIEAPAPSSVLVFSFVGMEQQKIAVGNRSHVDVALKEAVSSLDGVVVTGYQDIKESLFTGAAQSVKTKDIKLDGVPDVSSMLQGRAAGVNVTSVTGTFGAAPRITIRGSSSILGDTKPIWVIDGAIQEEIVNIHFSDLVSGNSNTLLTSAVAGLNPSDIQSIEILKDASAKALYGARALNGVIVITTKSGKRNEKIKVNYSGEFAFRTIPSYRNYNLLDSKENIALLEQVEPSFLRIEQLLQNRYGGVYNAYYRAVNTYDPTTGKFLAENTPNGRARFLQKYELANTDWFKVLFSDRPTQTHSIGLSGGGEKSSYYASLSYYHDPGWTIADRINRVTGHLKSTYHFSQKVSATVQLTGSFRDQKSPGSFDRTADNYFGIFNREFDINPFNYALNTSRTMRVRDEQGNPEYYRYNWAPFNIVEELKNNTSTLNVVDLRFQANLDYHITKHLKYSFLGTARYARGTSKHEAKDQSNVAQAYRANENTIVGNANTFLYTSTVDPTALPRVVLPYGGLYNETQNNIVTYTVRNTLDFEYAFNARHSMRIYAGQEMRYTDRENSFSEGYGYQYSRGGVVFTDPDIFQKLSQNNTRYFGASAARSRGMTFFATGTYSFDEKYIINITGNYEGSNRAGRSAATRWLPTYNVGFKWNIHKEPFLRSVGWISSLAIRPSYGLTALIADNVTNSLVVYKNDITNRFLQQNRENVININQLQNANLTWEKSYEFNLGLDASLFDGRVSFTLDWYHRNGVDLIDAVRTSGIGGESTKLINNANMTTQGIELQLNTVNIKRGSFRWTTTINLSHFDQRITRLEQKPNVYDLVSNVGGSVLGYPRGSLFSFQFTGLTKEGLPTFYFHDDRDILESGVDFQETLDIQKYLKYEGRIEPNLTGGIANNFSYKNWTFGVFITAQSGNVIRLPNAFGNIENTSDIDAFIGDFKDRWLHDGDELTTNFPAIPSRRIQSKYGNNLQQIYSAYNFSDQRVVDGSFVRLKNVSLAYSFPRKWLSRIGLNTLTLTAQGTNIALIYSDPGLRGQDPEFFRSGGVAYPINPQYTLSLNIGI